MTVNLRTIREEKGLTQKETAERSGISRAFYTQIENGKRGVSFKTAKKIAEVFNIEWTYFFED